MTENKSTRLEINPDELDAITGGNDDVKDGQTGLWTCPRCGQTIQLKKAQDKEKHMTKCPNK